MPVFPFQERPEIFSSYICNTWCDDDGDDDNKYDYQYKYPSSSYPDVLLARSAILSNEGLCDEPKEYVRRRLLQA